MSMSMSMSGESECIYCILKVNGNELSKNYFLEYNPYFSVSYVYVQTDKSKKKIYLYESEVDYNNNSEVVYPNWKEFRFLYDKRVKGKELLFECFDKGIEKTFLGSFMFNVNVKEGGGSQSKLRSYRFVENELGIIEIKSRIIDKEEEEEEEEEDDDDEGKQNEREVLDFLSTKIYSFDGLNKLVQEGENDDDEKDSDSDSDRRMKVKKTTLLCKLTKKGRVKKVKKLLEKYSSNPNYINMKDKDDKSAIHYAYINNSDDHQMILKLLLEQKATIDVQELVEDIELIKIESLEKFLELKEYREKVLDISLYKSMLEDNFDFFKTIINTYSSIIGKYICSIIVGYADTVLHYSIRMIKELEDQKYFKELIKIKGIDINTLNYRGKSCLQISMKTECFDVTKQLLNMGANIKLKEKFDIKYTNLLFYLIEKENEAIPDIIKIVLEKNPMLRNEIQDSEFNEVTPLILCIQRNNVNYVKALLSVPNYHENHLYNAAKESIKYGRCEILKLILEYSKYEHFCDIASLLFMTIDNKSESSVDCFKELLKVKDAIKMNKKYKNNETLISYCFSKEAKEEIIVELLKLGSKINKIKFPLHFCAKLNYKELFLELIKDNEELKKRINERDKDGDTLLMKAAKFGSEDVLIEALAANADPSLKTVDEKTCFNFACENGWCRLVKILLAISNQLNQLSTGKYSPMALSAKKCHFEIVELLISLPNHSEKSLKQTMHYSIVNGKKEIYNKLKEKLENNFFYFPIHDLIDPINVDFLKEMLNDHQCLINEKDDNNETLLFKAIKELNYNLVDFLLNNGGNILHEKKTPTLDNVAHYAFKNNKIELIKYLCNKFPALFSIKNKEKRFPFQYIQDNDDGEEMKEFFKEFVKEIEVTTKELPKMMKIISYEITFMCSGKDLARKNKYLPSSDPFFEFLVCDTLLYKSEKILRNLNPEWKQGKFIFDNNNFSLSNRITVNVYDWNMIEENVLIGKCEFTVKELLEGKKEFKLVVPYCIQKKNKKIAKEEQIGDPTTEGVFVFNSFVLDMDEKELLNPQFSSTKKIVSFF